MSNRFKYLIVLMCLFLIKTNHAQNVNQNYEDGNIYMKINTNIVSKNNKIKEINELPFLVDFTHSYTVTSFRQLYSFAKHPGLENIYKISILETNLIDQAIKDLSKIKELDYAEKVPYKTYFAIPPNDTSYNNSLQWNLFKINAQIAWNFIGPATPSQTIIAIIDDGLDITHVDLKDNVWINNAELNGLPGIDDDGNFIIDDSLGYDFGNFDNDPNPNSLNWTHGTHVAGIAGAVTNNLTGIASIGYNSKLMAVKGSNSNLFVSNGYEAVAYAADNGADVINLSWGSPIESITEENTILYAYLLGATVVAAAGNSNDATVNYPAAYPHAISVASTASNDTKANGTTYGQWIDVSAPGNNIYSTIPGNTYGYESGTSMAAPLVAGLAGLMKTYNPLLTPDQVKDCIKNNTDNIDFMNPNLTGKLGTGRINAFKSMQCVNATRNQIDAALINFQMPDAFYCASNITPKLGLKNVGIQNLQNLTINYQVDGGALNTILWEGNMEYDSLQFLNLENWNLTSGEHTIIAYCSNPNGILDWNFLNDTIEASFKIYNAGLSLPFVEDFESGFENHNWRIENPDNDKTWMVKSGMIDSIPNKAAFINLFNYENEKERDGLISPPLNFSGYDSLKLQFEYAWQKNFRQEADSLIIYASLDCGATFQYRLAAFSQDSLFPFATTNDTMDVFFNPMQSSQWCGNIISCINIDLSFLAGNSSVLLKFETFNRFNNNWYLDNINVFGDSSNTSAPSGNSISANANAVCQGEVITFTAVDPNNNVTQWNWNFPNGIPNSATGQSVTIRFNNPGNVNGSVVVGNSNGTLNVPLTNTIIVNPFPNVNILQNDTAICADNSITLNATGAAQYLWSPSFGLSDSVGNLVNAKPQEPITYVVMGTSIAGCINYDTIAIDTTICLGMLTNDIKNEISIYFNYATSQLFLKTGDLDLKDFSVKIYDALGQTISQITVNQIARMNAPLINCSNLSNGIYFVSFANQFEQLKTQKVLISKQ